MDTVPASLLYKTIGVLNIGHTLNAALWGISSIQVYTYYQRCRSDHAFIKSVIFILWILSTLEMAVYLAATFYYTVENFMNPAALLAPPCPCILSYASRINDRAMMLIEYRRKTYILLGRIFIKNMEARHLPAIMLVVVMIILSCGSGIAYFVLTLNRTYEDDIRYSWLWYVMFASALVADMTLAVSMCTTLYKNRTGIRRTDNLIRDLILYSVNTCTLATLTRVASMIAFAVGQGSYTFMLVSSLQPRVIFSSLLSFLNSRESAQQKFTGDLLSIHLSRLPNPHDHPRESMSESCDTRNDICQLRSDTKCIQGVWSGRRHSVGREQFDAPRSGDFHSAEPSLRRGEPAAGIEREMKRDPAPSNQTSATHWFERRFCEASPPQPSFQSLEDCIFSFDMPGSLASIPVGRLSGAISLEPTTASSSVLESPFQDAIKVHPEHLSTDVEGGAPHAVEIAEIDLVASNAESAPERKATTQTKATKRSRVSVANIIATGWTPRGPMNDLSEVFTTKKEKSKRRSPQVRTQPPPPQLNIVASPGTTENSRTTANSRNVAGSRDAVVPPSANIEDAKPGPSTARKFVETLSPPYKHADKPGRLELPHAMSEPSLPSLILTLHFDKTLGALNVGYALNALLYGVATTQYYSYAQRHARDHIFLRLLLTPHWSILADWLIGLFGDCAVTGVYAFRVWKLGNNLKWLTVGVIASMTLFSLATGIVFFSVALGRTYEEVSARWSWLWYATFGSQLVADIIITTTLCKVLYERRTGIRQTDSILRVLMLYTINTCALTSVMRVGSILSFAVGQGTYAFITVSSLLPRIIFSSLLALLNSREDKPARQRELVSIRLSRLRSKPSQATAGSSSGEIRVNTTVERTYDGDDTKPGELAPV
ncbi:hypothetical protein NM688_g1385 [Phlebia brevispora]|uniref:Uncharacterized protein n=1 Tax=Phlebia brevispora TaxID=194682 RepID=A0ACC1TBT9_9APHY|nr:hypothetical protein NM688_g1385 [Phlebia brevispora]